jgi:hypothetical protein
MPHEAPPGNTRRGIGLLFFAQVVTVLFSLLGLLFGALGGLFGVAYGLLGVLVLSGLLVIHQGRFEWSVRHMRLSRLAIVLGSLAAIAITLALLSIPSTVPETRRPGDLGAPVLLLGFGLVCVAAAACLLGWSFVSLRARAALAAYAAFALGATAKLVADGLRLVDDLVLRFGATVSGASQGHLVVTVFLQEFLPWLWSLVLALSLGAGLIFWSALGTLVKWESQEAQAA